MNRSSAAVEINQRIPVVYVVQEPMILDRATGRVRPRFSLDPAKRYGTISILLGWSEEVKDSRHLLWILRDRLKDYSDGDYILMTGSPTMMAIAACVAAEFNMGRVKLLNWDNLTRQYEVEEFDIHAQPLDCR
jgi:hypothetical protein